MENVLPRTDAGDFWNEKWLKIADRLSELLGRCFSIRSVRERLNLILLRFSGDQKKKLESSGREEEQSELEDLLQQATDNADECGYMPQPSTIRKLAECDGIKRAKGNSVARSPAKRRIDDRKEDALAAYAEFTVGDGVEPGNATVRGSPLMPTLVKPDGWPTLVCLCEVHSGTLRQHMPSLRPVVIRTLQSRTATFNLERTGCDSR
nr:uncharacterized protein LOC119182923 [Rhipicephalus microplus]